MIIAGKIRDGKKLYNIKAVTVGDFEEYSKQVKKGDNPFKTLEKLTKKTIFRIVELVIFGKVIFRFEKYDFKVNVIPMQNLDKFQEDFFNIILGTDFLVKARERGLISEHKQDIKSNQQD